MATREGKNATEESSIAAFYAGRSILITGGTGFIGKVLIEKLLRSCPDVREVFLLIRPKRGETIDERLKGMLQLPLFDLLREKNPSCFEKLIPVSSNICMEGLGLGDAERRLLTDRVSVIFHVAANVRFNHNLQMDIFSNVRSTRDICILAGGMKKLVALMHVSTAYSQSDKPVIKEIMYPSPCDWRAAIRIAETVDEETLRIFAKKFVDPMPNTYTFSKRLAEQVINDYAKDLPSVVLRPSIVVSTASEPIPGWNDNFNGPVGLMVAGGKGILRVLCIDPSVTSDYLPVDVVVKVMLSSIWKRGMTTITKDPSVHVYNATNSDITRVCTGQVIDMGLKICEIYPIGATLWYPRTYVTTNLTVFYVLTLFLHVLPAIFVDALLKATGRQPMLLDVQKKIYNSMTQLNYFMNNEWFFKNGNVIHMLKDGLPPADQQIFGYEYHQVIVRDYFVKALFGAKRYLLNDDMTRIEDAKRHYERMKLVDTIFNCCLLVLFTWILAKVGVFSYATRTISSVLDGSFLSEE